MTLLLPKNICENYVFAYNETHAALILDYGSVINHHESPNVEAIHFSDFPPLNDVHFRVRMGVVCGYRNVLQICSLFACTHA